jgi:gamma-glutamyltranspeptidase/glutathione hydrolase
MKLVSIFSILVFFCLYLEAQPYQINKQVIAENGMVVAAHPLASEEGLKILKKGGNAIDAMVTVHFVLAVVYQRAGNIAGGGFMVFRDKDGKSSCLDFREKAPLKAFRDMYLNEKGAAVDSLSRDGHLAVGVPGSVAGMFEAHQKYGKLPWSELVEPAIRIAEKGYILTDLDAKELNGFLNDFIKNNRYLPVFCDLWKAGDKLIQKDLAKTLRFIWKNGRDGFYKGKVADLIVEEMKAGKGIISYEDLEKYEAKWRTPIQFRYKENYNIITMPPPSSGGIILALMMNMAENQNLRQKGFHSASSIHLIAEIERRAYADRAKHLGDSDFYPVPLEGLLDKSYANSRISDFDPIKASKSQNIEAGIPRKSSEETTHYSIVDQEGNAVAVTTTLNGNYGSKVIVKGGGFFLNNEMDDFSAKPGTPNMFGLVGAEANAIQPGKRMLSSMTPTIVEKDGKLHLVVGTPGGATIISSVYQVLLNVLEYELGLQDAVQKPRFHHQWLPDQIYHEENSFDESTQKSLKALGHKLQKRGNIGLVDAIMVLPDGKLEGAADYRYYDSASGY